MALEVPPGSEDRALDAARDLGLAGANLTTPLKERALGRLELEPSARAIGAVNLVLRDGDRWIGANTDAEGFCRSVEARGVEIPGRAAAVIGTGGAARATALGLAGRGARALRVLGRRPEAARGVALAVEAAFPRVSCTVGPIGTNAIAGAEIVVVATSGRPSSVAALDPAVLAEGAAWIDLNYWDPDPPGFAAAAARGCVVVDGSGMLAWQAALSFERWTGILPVPD